MPGGAGHKTAMRPSLWWLLENIAKTFLPTKKVGSPCDNFSHVPGIARQIRRTRSRWSSIMPHAAARARRHMTRRAAVRAWRRSPRPDSALMLGVSATLELSEVGVAFVLKFLVDADLGGVITVNGYIFDRLEELLFRSLRPRLVLADLCEGGDLLVFGRLVEGGAVLVLAQFVHGGQAVGPGLFDLGGRLTDHQVDELRNFGFDRARRVVVGWDDQLRDRRDERHLFGVEEFRLVRGLLRLRFSGLSVTAVIMIMIMVAREKVCVEHRKARADSGEAFQGVAARDVVFLF